MCTIEENIDTNLIEPVSWLCKWFPKLQSIKLTYFNTIPKNIFARLLFDGSKQEDHIKQIRNISIREGRADLKEWEIYIDLNDVLIGLWDDNKVNVVHVNKVIIDSSHSQWVWVNNIWWDNSQNFLIIQNK